nr:LysM domain-containing protein [Tepidiforma sp.]
MRTLHIPLLALPLLALSLLAPACGGGGANNRFADNQTATAAPNTTGTQAPGTGGQQPTSPAPAATPTPTPARNPGTYTVQEGDTLGAIAERFGVTIADLVTANGLADPDLIYPGQELTIPAATTPTPTP